MSIHKHMDDVMDAKSMFSLSLRFSGTQMLHSTRWNVSKRADLYWNINTTPLWWKRNPTETEKPQRKCRYTKVGERKKHKDKYKGGRIAEKTPMPVLWSWYYLFSLRLSKRSFNADLHWLQWTAKKRATKRSCVCLTVSLLKQNLTGFWADYFT